MDNGINIKSQEISENRKYFKMEAGGKHCS